MRSKIRVFGRPALFALTIGAFALPIAACGSSSSDSSTSSSSGSSTTAATTADAGSDSTKAQPPADLSGVKGKKVALVTCEPNVFCHAYNVNLSKKLKAAGIDVTQLSDNFDPALQNQHMNQAIAGKPDAIVLFASNANAVGPALKRAKAANVPVINVNARLPASSEKLLTTEIVADNAALGKAAAENLVEGMKKAGYDKGNIFLITGTMGTLIVQDRLDAFNAYMKDYPQYKIVATEDGNWDQVKTAQIASQLFTKYRSKGGIQGAYGMADYQAAGIIQAADQLGICTGAKPGCTVVTASNCTPAGIPLMQSGKLYGNATQSPIEESENAYGAITSFLNGDKVDKTYTVKEERFTQDNVKDYVDLCANWPK